VFTSPDGTGLHPGWVTDQFHLLARLAVLPPIRLHDLRHGAASIALAAGVDVKVVSEMLGHSGTAITRDIYTSVYPELKRSATAATMQARVTPPGPHDADATAA
jgi:integrase